MTSVIGRAIPRESAKQPVKCVATCGAESDGISITMSLEVSGTGTGDNAGMARANAYIALATALQTKASEMFDAASRVDLTQN